MCQKSYNVYEFDTAFSILSDYILYRKIYFCFVRILMWADCKLWHFVCKGLFLNNFPTKHKTGLLFFKLNFSKITRNWNEWAHKDRKCIFWRKKKNRLSAHYFPTPLLSKNPLGTCIILLIVCYCHSYCTSRCNTSIITFWHTIS